LLSPFAIDPIAAGVKEHWIKVKKPQSASGARIGFIHMTRSSTLDLPA
jgi:hypothetical protein